MRGALAIAAALALAGCAHKPRPACAPAAQDVAAVERTVHAMYDALRRDDIAAFRRVTSDRFYSFDGGDRYDGVTLAEWVRDARAKGTTIEWSLGPLDTQLRCDVAWAQWENQGRVGRDGDVKPVRWLESAVLVRDGGRWKIDFFHSHRRAAN